MHSALLFLLFVLSVGQAADHQKALEGSTVQTPSNLTAVTKPNFFVYEYQTLEEYRHQIINEGFFGLFRDVESIGWTSLALYTAFHAGYLPVSSAKGVLKLPVPERGREIEKVVQLHEASQPFQIFFPNYWEFTAIGYALWNHWDKESTIERHLHKIPVMIADYQAGNITAAQFLSTWDREIHRQLREPFYGELAKFIWLECAARFAIRKFSQPDLPVTGPITYFAQHYYYQGAHMITFSLQTTSLALSFLNGEDFVPHYYRWKVSDQVIEGHLDYWIGNLYAPINGGLMFLSLYDARVVKIQQFYFLANLVVICANNLPVTIDRIKYLVPFEVEVWSNVDWLGTIDYAASRFAGSHNLFEYVLRFVGFVGEQLISMPNKIVHALFNDAIFPVPEDITKDHSQTHDEL